jgi:hypothetical protein
MLLNNTKIMKSLAERKRLWTGEKGGFDKADLVKWYKIYN